MAHVVTGAMFTLDENCPITGCTRLTRSVLNSLSIMLRTSTVIENESGSASQTEMPTLQKMPQAKLSTLKVDITKARRVRETETHLPLSWSPRLPSRVARALALAVTEISPLPRYWSGHQSGVAKLASTLAEILRRLMLARTAMLPQ